MRDARPLDACGYVRVRREVWVCGYCRVVDDSTPPPIERDRCEVCGKDELRREIRWPREADLSGS